MRPVLLLIGILFLLPVTTSTGTHTIVDETGLRDSLPNTHGLYFPVPEDDMDRVDAIVVGDFLNVSWHVVNLSHKSTPVFQQALWFAFTFSTTRSYPEATIMATRSGLPDTYPYFDFYWRNEIGAPLMRADVNGTFDWANSTVIVSVPLSFFQPGETIKHPQAWSMTCVWEPTGYNCGSQSNVGNIDDVAPNEGVGQDVRLP